MKEKDLNASAWVVFSAIFLYFLWPLLGSGLVSDDSYHSSVRGYLLYNHQSLWDYTFSLMKEWLFKGGRIYPIIFYDFPFFYFIRSVVAYKAIVIGVVALSLWVFRAFLASLGLGKSVTYFAVLLLVLLIQFRAWHDPLLAFPFKMPLLTTVYFLSFLSFQRFLNGSNRFKGNGDLTLSLLCFAFGCLMFELTYVCLPFYVLISWEYRKNLRKGLIDVLPFFLISCFFFSLFILLRTSLNPLYDPHYYSSANIDLSPRKGFAALLIQAYSSVPLSYTLRRGLFDSFHFWKRADAVFGVLVFIATYRTVLRIGIENLVKGNRFLLAFGSVLVLLPAFVIAGSGHQTELMTFGPGYGYIFVYLQYFGVSLIFLAGLRALLAWTQNRLIHFVIALMVASLITGVGLAHLMQNRSVVKEVNRFYKYPRVMLQEALDEGIMGQVPPDSLILIRPRYPIDAYAFFSDHLNQRVEVKGPEEFGRQLMAESRSTSLAPGVQEWIPEPGHPVFLVSYSFDPETGKSGIAYSAELSRAIYDTQTGALFALETPQIQSWQYPTKIIHQLAFKARPADFLKVMDWSRASPERLVSFNFPRFERSLVLEAWSGSFLPAEGDPEHLLRWCGNKGRLFLYNFGRASQSIQVSMNVASVSPTPSTLSLQFPNSIHEKLALSSAPQKLVRWLQIPPGKSEITFVSDGQRVANGDPRDLVFSVTEFGIKVR